MKTLVIDTSCLSDISKCSASKLLARLPNDLKTTSLVVNELRRFKAKRQCELLLGKTKIEVLTPELVQRSSSVLEEQASLSEADASLFALTENLPGSILLTGDRTLREFTRGHGIDVHGTIWLFQEFLRNSIGTPSELILALEKLKNDESVWLPSREISILIGEIKGDR